MKYEMILFDMDGTILDTLEDLADSINYALRTNGFKEHTIQEVRSYVGNGLKMLAQRALPEGVSKEIINKVYNEQGLYYKNHCMDKTKPYEGVVSLLRQLKKQGNRLVVVSNKADYAVKFLCSKYFENIFDLCIGEREGFRKKPYPDSVFEVLKAYHLNKDQVLYVGDSEVDIQTAENAGIDCVLVSWGFRDEEVLRKYGANTIVHSVEELLEYFECL